MVLPASQISASLARLSCRAAQLLDMSGLGACKFTRAASLDTRYNDLCKLFCLQSPFMHASCHHAHIRHIKT